MSLEVFKKKMFKKNVEKTQMSTCQWTAGAIRENK